jgi:hypothetical protein
MLSAIPTISREMAMADMQAVTHSGAPATYAHGAKTAHIRNSHIKNAKAGFVIQNIASLLS